MAERAAWALTGLASVSCTLCCHKRWGLWNLGAQTARSTDHSLGGQQLAPRSRPLPPRPLCAHQATCSLLGAWPLYPNPSSPGRQPLSTPAAHGRLPCLPVPASTPTPTPAGPLQMALAGSVWALVAHKLDHRSGYYERSDGSFWLADDGLCLLAASSVNMCRWAVCVYTCPVRGAGTAG